MAVMTAGLSVSVTSSSLRSSTPATRPTDKKGLLKGQCCGSKPIVTVAEPPEVTYTEVANLNLNQRSSYTGSFNLLSHTFFFFLDPDPLFEKRPDSDPTEIS